MSDRNRVFRPLSLVAAGVLVGLSSPLATALATTSPLISPTVAHAEPVSAVSGDVADLADVLTPEQEQDIAQKIRQLKQDKRIVFSVAYIKSFDGTEPKEWAHQLWKRNGAAENRGVIAIAVEDRNLGAWAGSSVSGDSDSINLAAQEPLFDDNWYEAGLAAVEAAGGRVSGSSEAGGWALGAGVGGAAVVGGGAWALSHRGKKKRAAQEVERGRTIAPTDVASLDSLSTGALDELAHEEIVSTDESIRKGQTELELARAEFGPDRVRPFDQALAHSRKTLERAFALRQQLDDGSVADETERRSIMLEIVSTCGKADDELDGQAENFQKLREELINADQTLAKLTQRQVEIRTRIPRAEQILGELKNRYDDAILVSVADNVEMANEHLNQSEQSLERARELVALPAGQQAGLIDALSATDLALTQADRLLASIEHAESDIAQANAGLDALIAEVRGEIDEATNLLSAPSGAEIDRARLNAAIEAGREALGVAENKSGTDPLSCWTALTDADDALDEALDSARDKAASFARATATLRNSMRDAENYLHAAADLIDTRRRVVGAKARARLSEAQRAYDLAAAEAERDPRRALTFARRARKLAAEAADLARRDIERYDSQRRGGGGGNSGAMIAGMVLGSMLNNSGGFGGGFGGGSGGNGSSMGF
ncbi:TPM domain-containing protein [Corynebacterium lactis]|uniref:TPM domain-containing protein n=1 Tax=Corynebacterium lactis TaxID=1231000 RepID=UPI001FE20DE7|nr:TPM domain-containing protein [Corynebacterium lactis]